ncbi:RIN4, pathogenic type III effector avirulence factor Avr cleavage site [Dillenia turbinata]|uniref:RIN4, pathogenic type III effector avirulence factor Avr cleavage site n=1 Tax=Dillenia turbinata TaxID=194707 RepID=A0AAN8V991_9MAGN
MLEEYRKNNINSFHDVLFGYSWIRAFLAFKYPFDLGFHMVESGIELDKGHSNVPKFGNWETEENVPYTTYFEKARKDRSGGKTNLNDPESNSVSSARSLQSESEPDLPKATQTVRPKHKRRFSREDGDLKGTDSPLHHDSPVRRTGHGGIRPKSELDALKGAEEVRPKHERRVSQEEGDLRKSIDSPSRHETGARRATGGASSGDMPRRTTRASAGSDRSLEQSPLNPHYQARVGGKGYGVSSPSWERKASSDGSHGFAPATPGRSRLRSVNKGDDTPDHTSAVPKFGEWDETNPASADGYTHIFNKVREERQIGAGKVPIMPTETTSHSNGQKQYVNDSAVVFSQNNFS